MKEEYSFVIYTDNDQNFVIFIMTELSKDNYQFPETLASELINQGYEHTGNADVFKLPKDVGKHACYVALKNKGYKYTKEISRALAKEMQGFLTVYNP